MARIAKRLLTTLPLLLALGAVGTTITSEASAQEIQLTGPLKGAPAVRKLRLYREGRFDVAVGPTFTILDEYNRTIILGARLNYGITDWLGIGFYGGFGAVNISTGLTDQIDQNAKRGIDPATGADVNTLTNMNVPGTPGSKTFQKQVAQIGFMAFPQLTAIPFRGKFALFQSVFADVDAYIFAGFGIVGTKERKDCGSFNECATRDATNNPTGQDAGNRLDSKSHLAPTWGLGFNFYMNKFMSLAFEWRMIPFAWNRGGFDTRGLDQNGKADSSGKFPDGKIDSSDATYKFNQMIGVMIGFSFPTLPKITD